MNTAGHFDLLSPDLVMDAVEGAYGLELDSRVIPYNSYINRVYGLQGEDGREYIAKFYRPGRWTPEALEEEHRFLLDCAEAEIPAALPLKDTEGCTLVELALPGTAEKDTGIFFCLFERKGGRIFDAEGAEDWRRLGRLAGRIHAVGRKGQFRHRLRQDLLLTAKQLEEIFPLVHPDLRQEFQETAKEASARASTLFSGRAVHRIHGDLHRGNILNRGPEGLVVMDFDDTLTGVPVQDLWLLLPGTREESQQEIDLLSQGYADFSDPGDLDWDLMEPLRFMRMVHHLAWCARQRQDSGFSRTFPDWGSRSFWIKETEDLREQLRRL